MIPPLVLDNVLFYLPPKTVYTDLWNVSKVSNRLLQYCAHSLLHPICSPLLPPCSRSHSQLCTPSLHPYLQSTRDCVRQTGLKLSVLVVDPIKLTENLHAHGEKGFWAKRDEGDYFDLDEVGLRVRLLHEWKTVSHGTGVARVAAEAVVSRRSV